MNAKIDDKNPIKVTFQRFLKENGRFYKNEREVDNASFFEDLNYGEILLKFEHHENKFNSKYDYNFVKFGNSFRIFLETINVISDETEMTQLTN